LVKAAAAPIAATGCLALPRSLFEAVGGFAPDYLGPFHRDADLSARVWQSGGHVSVAAEPYVIALHADNPKAPANSALARELDARLFEARWRSLIEALGALACEQTLRPATAAAKARPRPSRLRGRAA
jgi:GT2 family glycosyltransferase